MFKKTISAAVLAFTSPSESKSIMDIRNELESAISTLFNQGPKESTIATMLESTDGKDVSLEIDLNSLDIEQNGVFEADGDS